MSTKCPNCQTDNPPESKFCLECGTQVSSSELKDKSLTKSVQIPQKEIYSGKILSGKYRIISEIGRGGMGIVYKAQDTKLDRPVALKFLPSGLIQKREAKERFIREARAEAALSHPHICTIYEIIEDEDQVFIVMEYIEGESLKDRITKKPIPQDDAVDMIIQISEGLLEAHKKGIVHRDIKSANIMVTDTGQAKIMDFGLAKISGDTQITKEATTMGTVSYMSPEQAQGKTIDYRSDIWSLGVVIYEILSGELPFEGERDTSIMYSIIHEEPKPIKKLFPDIPFELQQIINSTLEKKLESRFQTIDEVLKNLKKYQERAKADQSEVINFRSFMRRIRKPIYAIPAVAAIVVACFLSLYFINQRTKIRWARNKAILEIVSLIEEDYIKDAYILAEKAEKYIPTDPQLLTLWPQISSSISAQTIPPGANIYVKDYDAIDEEWHYLGLSPLEDIRISSGYKRWKVEKDGYETVELAGNSEALERKIELSVKDSITPGMVQVPGVTITKIRQGMITGGDPIESIHLKNFLIDRFEVTNKQFKEFVDNGGYQKKEFWKHEFIKEGQILSWEKAMEEFCDETGRPGPFTWELGSYPDGETDLPVRGLSWYEAAAYAEYVGKSLPTIYHWFMAAGTEASSNIIPFSNFGNEGPAIVGSFGALNPYGSYDMAGNVREWCWNESRDFHYILGGAWSGPSYLFFHPIVLSPFDRSPTNGFRCVYYLDSEGAPQDAARSVELSVRDYYKEKPVDEALFQVYKQQFSYDPAELDASVESADDNAENWKVEKVSFNAAYSDERMIAYLYLPKIKEPPYQTIIVFPGSSAISLSSHEERAIGFFDYILETGRAVMFPILKGTYERNDGLTSTWPNTSYRYVEYLIKWVKDVKRSIDYLETRDDIDINRLAYIGISWGGRMGAIIPAVEDRLKASVLLLGGLASGRARPEVDQINYVPRVTIPTLMLNGKYDSIEPFETAQLTMYDLLGTRDEDKEHIFYDTDHSLPRNAFIKETLSWLDRYLGPVK